MKQRHPRIVWWAVGILFAGLLCAEVVYFAADADADTEAVAAMTRTKAYQHNMELVGGKAAVLAGGIADWIANLWHGRNLAYVIAVVTVIVSAGCLVVGWLQSPPRKDGPRPGR